MANWTADMIAAVYRRAQDSVNVINTQTSKKDDETDEEWKHRIKRNWQHLETCKAYKQQDDNTKSIWTTEDFTAVDAAIIKGKAVQS